MKDRTRPLPPGIHLQLLAVGVPVEHHGRVVVAMADRGDWWAKHWQTCGLLRGILSTTMCHNGHKPPADTAGFTPEQTRELAIELGLIVDEPDVVGS